MKRVQQNPGQAIPGGNHWNLWLPSLRFLKSHFAPVGLGLVLIFISELMSPSSIQNFLDEIAFVLLLVTGLNLVFSKRDHVSILETTDPQEKSTTWLWSFAGVTGIGIVFTQTWFTSGTALAGGDISPPFGTAWLRTIFSSFTWSGSNLGSPASNEGQLPWAVFNWLTNGLGGSGALAQRLWITFLVVSILVGALYLARSLRLTPVAGFVVALLYLYNPMTLTEVGDNTVYLVAMALIPILAAVSIDYGTKRVSLWRLVLCFILSAPFIGYAYSNPPLVGLLAVTTLVSPIIVFLRFDARRAKRSLFGVVAGGLSSVGVSAYWIIPSHIALAGVNSGGLSTLASWGFTEVRSTLANGFWLNSFWGWQYIQNFPYSVDFSRFPLRLIPSLVPVSAFALLAYLPSRKRLTIENRKLAGFITLGCLFVVLISTGTRTPGNIIFDPLYKLPYGWLLREPDRFLIIVALGYALLSGLFVAAVPNKSLFKIPASRFLHRDFHVDVSSKTIAVSILLLVSLASSFPLWNGALIQGPHDGFPSTHVAIPGYWQDVGNYLNTPTSPPGSIMVLPADDYYQMPYTWYYGNDGFITNLIRRHVIDPSLQGYNRDSTELVDAVKLESSSILNHQWIEATKLLNAVGTPMVLVRGDIEANFSGRPITSPKSLFAALSLDPDMTLVYRNGPIDLFKVSKDLSPNPTNFATVRTSTPDLRDLSVLAKNTALVSSKPIIGHDVILQVAPVNRWTQENKRLFTSLSLPVGWKYNLVSVNGESSVPASLTIAKGSASNDQRGLISLAATDAQSEQFISPDQFGSVSNCNDYLPVSKQDTLSSKILRGKGPGASNAISLSANIDSACVSKQLTWEGGPLLVHLEERSVRGSVSRICLWETPVNLCAKLSLPSSDSHWTDIDEVIHPDPGTKAINLTLYSDAPSNGVTSINEYAEISVRHLETVPDLAVIGVPESEDSKYQLLSTSTGYSKDWSGPPRSAHVVVDGLRNGWIVNSGKKKLMAVNSATSKELIEVVALFILSFVTLGMLLLAGTRIKRDSLNRVNAEAAD